MVVSHTTSLGRGGGEGLLRVSFLAKGMQLESNLFRFFFLP